MRTQNTADRLDEIMILADTHAYARVKDGTPRAQLPYTHLKNAVQAVLAENETLRTGYDAARLEIESLQAQAQQCGAGAGCCAQAARIEELEAQAYDRHAAALCSAARVMDLEAQLEAVGAGGVGPLVRRAAAGALTNEGTIAAQSQHEHWAAPQPAPAAPFENVGFEMWWADHTPNSARKDAWAEWCALWPSQQAAQVQEDAKDAARYRFLRNGEWRDTELEPFIRLQLNALWDSKIDAAIAAQQGTDAS